MLWQHVCTNWCSKNNFQPSVCVESSKLCYTKHIAYVCSISGCEWSTWYIHNLQHHYSYATQMLWVELLVHDTYTTLKSCRALLLIQHHYSYATQMPTDVQKITFSLLLVLKAPSYATQNTSPTYVASSTQNLQHHYSYATQMHVYICSNG